MRPSLSLTVLAILLVSTVAGVASGGSVQPAHRISPAQSSPNHGVYFFNTSDAASVPAMGVSMSVTAFSMPEYTGNGSASVQIVAGIVDRGSYVVAGLEANTSLPTLAVYSFAAVLNDTTGAIEAGQLGPIAQPGTLVHLSVTLNGTHTWQASANGTVLLNWSSGGGAVTNPSYLYLATLFGWNSSLWTPSEIFLPELFQVEGSQGWFTPEDEYTQWIESAFPMVPPPWKIASTQTNASLSPGEVFMGSAVTSPQNGTNLARLWSSVPVAIPAQLLSYSSSTTVVGGQPVALSWRVLSATPPSLPLAGVSLAYWSSWGGPYGLLTSDALGWANATLPTRNVSEQRFLFLNASLLNASYTGASSLGILVTSVIQLTVTLSGRNETVDGKARVELVVHLTNSGTPQGGGLFYPSANYGGGVFTPAAPWVSNSQGYAYGNYTPPDVSTTVTLWVNASYAGATAPSSITVVVNGGHPPPPSTASETPLWEYGVIAAVIALVIILAMVAMARHRRGMDAQELGEEPPSSTKAE